MPKPCTSDVATNTKYLRTKTSTIYKEQAGYGGIRPDGKQELNSKSILTQLGEGTAKVDVYYFDHGNAA